MKTYEFIKDDGTKWIFYYDRSIRSWTAYEIDEEGNQISIEADYFHDKTGMISTHGFNFKKEYEN